MSLIYYKNPDYEEITDIQLEWQKVDKIEFNNILSNFSGNAEPAYNKTLDQNEYMFTLFNEENSIYQDMLLGTLFTLILPLNETKSLISFCISKKGYTNIKEFEIPPLQVGLDTIQHQDKIIGLYFYYNQNVSDAIVEGQNAILYKNKDKFKLYNSWKYIPLTYKDIGAAKNTHNHLEEQGILPNTPAPISKGGLGVQILTSENVLVVKNGQYSTMTMPSNNACVLYDSSIQFLRNPSFPLSISQGGTGSNNISITNPYFYSTIDSTHNPVWTNQSHNIDANILQIVPGYITNNKTDIYFAIPTCAIAISPSFSTALSEDVIMGLYIKTSTTTLYASEPGEWKIALLKDGSVRTLQSWTDHTTFTVKTSTIGSWTKVSDSFRNMIIMTISLNTALSSSEMCTVACYRLGPGLYTNQ